MVTAKKAGLQTRRLVVTFKDDSKTPDFVFEGRWTGFEVSTVGMNLRRAYLRMTRDLRRSAVSEQSTNPAKEES